MSTLSYGAKGGDTTSTCIANFSYYSQNGTVYFTDSSKTAIQSYLWTFGDNDSAFIKNPVHTYASGIYNANVCLMVKNSAGNYCYVCKSITVRPKVDSCKADFTYTLLDSTSAATLYRFTDISTGIGGIASRSWRLSDSTKSTSATFDHRFDSTLNTVSACLTITTNNGCKSSVCKTFLLPAKCQADFYYSALNGKVSFTESSYTNGAILTRAWTFGDSATSNQKNPTHTYASNVKTAYVCYAIATTTGYSCSACKLITVRPLDSCVANFSYVRIDTSGVNLYRFKDSSFGTYNITSRFWTLSDSTHSNDSIFVHQFSSNLTYATARLAIATASGCQSSITKTFLLKDTIPVVCNANFVYTQLTDSVYKVPTYAFTNSSSSNATSFLWNFGDGTTSTLKNPVHAYNYLHSGDIVNVRLQISTSSNCVDTMVQTIVIPGTPIDSCFAGFIYTRIDNSGVYPKVEFLNTSIGTNPITASYWTFGDSTRYNGMDSVITHQYPSNLSTVQACLTIVTSSGCQSSICKTITFDTVPAPCVANFTDSVMNSTVYFYSRALVYVNAATWRWQFGDGTTSTLLNPVHTYASGYTHPVVCLTVTTGLGADSCSICKEIILHPDTIIPTSCHANFTYVLANDSVSSGLPLRTRVYFTDASTSTGAITYRNWFFGDGTTSTLQNPTHVYSFANDTTVAVGLFIGSAGCGDSIFKNILIPGYSTSFSISGTVVGKNELLKSGIIVLYKKATSGLFKIVAANVISNGTFNFGQLSAGKYIIYAMPDIYNSTKYLPTYYVNKVHWADAQVINLNSNAYGLKLKLVSAYTITTGPGKISGTVTSTGAALVEKSALKSAASYSYPVNLIGESGETLLSTTPDELGNFAFDNLPYGKYSVNIEYPNISNQNLTVNLSPESPVATDLNIVIDESATSVNSLTKEAKAVIYNVSTDQIAVRLNAGGKYNMSLISMTGRVILNGQIDFESNTDKIISIGSLPNGIYLIKLQNNANIITEKIFR